MHQKYFFILAIFVLFGLDMSAQHRPTINRSLLEVKPTKLAYSSNGGTKKIEVKSGSDWKFNVSDASWCHVNKLSNGLSVSVDENETETSRSTSIRVSNAGKSDKVIVVSQDPSAATNSTFSVSPNNKRFKANGGTQTMTVTGGENWSIDVNVASWAHLNKNGNSLTLSVDRNNSTSNRSDYFVLKSGAKKFRIDFSQEGQPVPTFSVSPNNKQFDADGGTQTMTVTGGDDWSIDVNVATWAHLIKNGNSLTLSVDRNTSISSRSDFFILKSGEKKIRVDFSQVGMKRYIYVGNNDIRVNSKNHFETVSVQSNGNWEVSVPPAEWVVLKKNTSSVDLQIKSNKSRIGRSDYFVLRSGTEVQRVNIYQNGREIPWLFRKETGFSSHFLDLQIGFDLLFGADKYCIGGSYTFVPSHIGFRLSAISEFQNMENFTRDNWILSAGPVLRLTNDPSKLDFQVYICPAFWNNSLAWDGGFRFGWHSNNRLSLWDFTIGALLSDEKVVPTLGLGIGISTSPLIGAAAVCFGGVDKHSNSVVPHYFLDCNFACSKSGMAWTGLAFDWNPYRFGFHSSYWLVNDNPALSLGLNWRLFNQDRLFDIQLYGGIGMSSDFKFEDKEVVFDFGTRLNFENHRSFAWYDITIGGLYMNGQIIPTIGCGLCLSSLIGGIGALQTMLK